jgi:hypothetical protein
MRVMVAAISSRRSCHPVSAWTRAVSRVLVRCAKRAWFGTIRIEVYDGQVRRIVVERSVMDPDALAADEIDSVESGSSDDPGGR